MRNNLILHTAHLILRDNINPGDIMIDATMGNGNDTVFLAQHAQYVYAFDIQERALIETQKKLDKKKFQNVKLILDSHENIFKYVSHFKGVVFNLGYLPNADKTITTKQDITLKTIETLLPALKVDSFILIVVYTGHDEGMFESIVLNESLKNLDQSIYKVLRIDLPFQDNQPPYIFFIHKVKDESI
ncbi:MAG: class I SAM-dependent methyltransferase [Bacillota bacterium]